MNHLKVMNLPASHKIMSEEEMQYTEGGGAVQAVLGGVVAVGVSAMLLYATGVVQKSAFEGTGAVIDGVKNVIGNAIG